MTNFKTLFGKCNIRPAICWCQVPCVWLDWQWGQKKLAALALHSHLPTLALALHFGATLTLTLAYTCTLTLHSHLPCCYIHTHTCLHLHFGATLTLTHTQCWIQHRTEERQCIENNADNFHAHSSITETPCRKTMQSKSSWLARDTFSPEKLGPFIWRQIVFLVSDKKNYSSPDFGRTRIT